MNSGKYEIRIMQNDKGFPVGRLVNIATGIPIPDDEPVFVLRAKDDLAVQTLEYYQEFTETDPFASEVDKCLKAFQEWQAANPDKVKEPD